MSENDPTERRNQPERRVRQLPFWHPVRLRGRRAIARREDEAGKPYLVERISARSFLLSSLLLLLTLIDGMLTFLLLDIGCEEANPAMRYLLERGPIHFFVGKYLLTAIFLPVSLVMNRCRLFGTRIRVGHVVTIVAGLYLVLIAYQIMLWHEHASDMTTTQNYSQARR
jgi:hypothetical protein